MLSRLVAALLLIALLIFTRPPDYSGKLTVGEMYRFCGYLEVEKELEKGCIYTLHLEDMRIKAVKFYGSCTSGFTCFYGRVEVYRGEKEVVIVAGAN